MPFDIRLPKAFRSKMHPDEKMDEIQLSSSEMAAIFDPVVHEITVLVADICRKCHEVTAQRGDEVRPSAFVLVGGLSESPYIVSKLKEHLQQSYFDCTVVTPPNAGIAVGLGAVHFGLSPSCIASRCMRQSIYTRTLFEYEEGDKHGFHHPKTGKHWTRRLHKYVSVNQKVAVGFKYTQVFSPASSDATSILLPLYCSPYSESRYHDDLGVKKLGELEISVPANPDPTKRQVELSLLFSETTFEALAKNVETGESQKVALKFEAE